MKTALQILDEMIEEAKYPSDRMLLGEAKERIQKDTGWISVAVRLPETYHQMMFIDYHKNIYIGFFVGNGNWESNHIIIPDNITHWMPLPLPPNE